MEKEQKEQVLKDLRGTGQRIGTGALAGLISGFLVGGVGGRLAMFLLRITSGPEVKGIKSDDGFIIGSFSSDTTFLVAAATAGGIFGGIVYVAVRKWIPERMRIWVASVLFAVTIGPAVIRPEGVDFTRLKPLPLAVALFVLLPALYGFLVSKLIERWSKKEPGHTWPFFGLLPLAILGATGPVGIGLIVIILAAWLVGMRIEVVRKLPSTPVVTFLARGLMIALGIFGLTLLVKDAFEVLV